MTRAGKHQRIEDGRYEVSKRLWAMAAFSRFIKPSAHRIPALCLDSEQVKVAAFRNPSGMVVVNALNLAHEDLTVRLHPASEPGPRRVRMWATDEERSLAPVDCAPEDPAAVLTARTLTTFVLTEH